MVNYAAANFEQNKQKKMMANSIMNKHLVYGFLTTRELVKEKCY